MFTGHKSAVSAVALSPSGYYCASADVTGRVLVWATDGDFVVKLDKPIFAGPVLSIAWSGDSQRLVAVGEGKDSSGVAFALSGENMGDVIGHTSRVSAAAFRPNRPFRILTGGDDASVFMLQGPPFKMLTAVEGHTNRVTGLGFSSDGALFASVSSDKSIRVGDGKSGAFLAAVQPAHTMSIMDVAWSPFNPRRFVTVSVDATLALWEVSEARDTVTLIRKVQPRAPVARSNQTRPHDPSVQLLGTTWAHSSHAPEGVILAVAADGTISFHDPESLETTCLLPGHQRGVAAVAPSDAGVVAVSWDGQALFWSKKSLLSSFVAGAGHSGSIAASAVSAKDAVIFTAGRDDCVRSIRPGSAMFQSGPHWDQGSLSLSAAPVAVSAGPGCLAVASHGEAVLYVGDSPDSVTKSQVLLPPSSNAEFSAVAVASPSLFAAGTDTGAILLVVEPVSAAAPISLSVPGGVTALAFSPDGTHLAATTSLRNVFIYKLDEVAITLAPSIRDLSYHAGKVTAVAWAADSQAFATGGLDGSVIVYPLENAAAGRRTAHKVHEGGVTAVAFDGSHVVYSGGADAVIHRFDL
jgi:WD40 repeat protein